MTATLTRASARAHLAQQRPPTVGRVAIDKLQFHPLNIRVDLGDLRSLTASIAAEGVLQPLLAHRKGAQCEVLDGHRRLAAARLAGLRTVPTMVLPAREPDEAICLMLATALTGSGVTAEERRRAVRALIDDYGHTIAALARRFGVAPTTISAWAAEPKQAAAKRAARPVSSKKLTGLIRAWMPRIEHGLSAAAAAELLQELAVLAGHETGASQTCAPAPAAHV